MSRFTNFPVPAGTSTVFANEFTHYRETLTFGVADEHGDKLLAIVLDSDGNIVEWITTDSNLETAVNIATWGEYLVFWDIVGDMGSLGAAGSIISAMIHERALYSDCFHWSEDTQENLPESWTNGANPKFTSTLPV